MEGSGMVSTQELAALIGQNNVYVIDATFGQPDVAQKHAQKRIPGAQFFKIATIKASESPLSFELPSAAEFAEYMRAIPLRNDGKLVVIYDQNGFGTAGRAWVTLTYFGYSNVKVLDGGLPKWEAEGRELATGEHAQTEPDSSDNYAMTEHPEMRIYYDEMKTLVRSLENNDQNTVIWDPRPVQMIEGGAVPQVCKCPGLAAFNEDKTIKSPQEVRKLLEDAGIDLGKPVVLCCLKGVTAAQGYFLLKYIGKHDIRVYSESYEEWSMKQKQEQEAATN